MSYEPTVWKPGDKITSRRMNKLEEGLAGVETGGVYLVKNLDETVEGKALDATVGPGIRDRLAALESASSVVLEGRVDQLEDDLATTNSNVSTLSSSLNTTNTNVSALDTNIQGVASRVTTVEGDISDINDAMAVPTWDSAEETITFTSDDDAQGNATSWTSVPLIESGEKHKSIFNKFTTMVKNIRYLYNMLGTTDISSIGSGTVTSALGNLNTRVGTLNDAITSLNNATTWKNAGTETGGQTAITIPAGWKEANVRIGLGGTRYFMAHLVSTNFNFAADTGYNIRNGYYQNTGNNGYVSFWLNTKTTGVATVGLADAYLTGQDMVSTTTIQVRYR